MKPFTPEERRSIEVDRRAGDPLVCPACRVPLDLKPVPPSTLVSYVRRRLVVVCPSCRAHAVLDRSEGSRDSADG